MRQNWISYYTKTNINLELVFSGKSGNQNEYKWQWLQSIKIAVDKTCRYRPIYRTVLSVSKYFED